MRLGIERTTAKDSFDVRRFGIVVAPGMGLCVLALMILVAQDEDFLIVLLQATALAVGSLFALLGYRLFAGGFRGESDVEARLRDKVVILKNFAPGTLFALFGLVMISVALIRGLAVVSSSRSEGAATTREVVAVVDRHAATALGLVQAYMAGLQNTAVSKPAPIGIGDAPSPGRGPTSHMGGTLASPATVLSTPEQSPPSLQGTAGP